MSENRQPRIASRDADVGDMLAIIGHPAGVPKRIEAGPLTSFNGDQLRYHDIDTLGGNSGSAIWQSPSGLVVGVHINGGCSTGGGESNSGVRLVTRPRQENDNQLWILEQIRRVYTTQQLSSGRFVDAHEHDGEDSGWSPGPRS